MICTFLCHGDVDDDDVDDDETTTTTATATTTAHTRACARGKEERK